MLLRNEDRDAEAVVGEDRHDLVASRVLLDGLEHGRELRVAEAGDLEGVVYLTRRGAERDQCIGLAAWLTPAAVN